MERQKKILLFTICICAVMASVVILIAAYDRSPEPPTVMVDLSQSSTPTPCPLPTRSSKPSSKIITLFNQIFKKHTSVPELVTILTEGELQVDTDPFALYTLKESMPVDKDRWAENSTQVFSYVTQRSGIIPTQKIIVAFLPPDNSTCPVRGTSFNDKPPLILIYADQNTSQEQISATLAHELGHVLAYQQYPQLTDVALSEGFATWSAGAYWSAWQGIDFDDFVRSSLREGTYLPLWQNYDLNKAYDRNSSTCLADRDALLTEMASFIDYLVRTYGADKLTALFNVRPPETGSKRTIVYPPDYASVYGLELNQLEYLWLQNLMQQENMQ
jgi:hypothetical protein